MSFWNKLIGKKKNTKSIVVYERENKKLWDYVRLLTELLEEKDKEIKSLNTEIKKYEDTKGPSLKKNEDQKISKVNISKNPDKKNKVEKVEKEKVQKVQKNNKSNTEVTLKNENIESKSVSKKKTSTQPVNKPKVDKKVVQEKNTEKSKKEKSPTQKVSKDKVSKDKESNNEETILEYIKSKKIFFDYKAISEGTNLPESIVRTMISRLKKKGVNLEEKKDGKRKLIKFVK
ncbi:MAG: hypothetical protein PHT94_03225 [Candidatus Nanoarchaeia archaeon]|nr:hypothetical protein [Candidatus Nanoarchaeia archaeon]